MGPLTDADAVAAFLTTIQNAQSEGGKVLCGGTVLSGGIYENGLYVKPCIIEAENHYNAVQTETFAPILYLIKYSGGIHEALALQTVFSKGYLQQL